MTILILQVNIFTSLFLLLFIKHLLFYFFLESLINIKFLDVYGRLDAISCIEDLEVKGRNIKMRRLVVELSKYEL
jgi:hypothetical protein